MRFAIAIVLISSMMTGFPSRRASSTSFSIFINIGTVPRDSAPQCRGSRRSSSRQEGVPAAVLGHVLHDRLVLLGKGDPR